MSKSRSIFVGALGGALLTGGIRLALPRTALGQDDSADEAMRRFKALSNGVADQKERIEALEGEDPDDEGEPESGEE